MNNNLKTAMQLNNAKSVWLSGEVCSIAGTYFSDSCGHEIEKELTANDIFPRCQTCHRAVRWNSCGAGLLQPQKTLNLDHRSHFSFLYAAGHHVKSA